MQCPDTSHDTAQAEAQNEAQRQTQIVAAVRPGQRKKSVHLFEISSELQEIRAESLRGKSDVARPYWSQQISLTHGLIRLYIE